MQGATRTATIAIAAFAGVLAGWLGTATAQAQESQAVPAQLPANPAPVHRIETLLADGNGIQAVTAVAPASASVPVFGQAMPGIGDVAALAGVASGAVTADVVLAQRAVGNIVTEENVSRSVVFAGSGNNHSGLLAVNQDAGNLSSQANIHAIAVSTGGAAVESLHVYGVQELRDNTVTVRDSGPRETRIVDSFQGGAGIVGINQSAGNLNQQLNVVAVGVGLLVGPDAIQLNDVMLEAVGGEGDNTLIEEGEAGPRELVVANSFTDFSGVAQVNQSTGDMNRVSNVVGLSIVQVMP